MGTWTRPGLPQAALPAPAAPQWVGGGSQPPVSSSTLSGLGEALICPQGLWRHKGGTAARNPSMCHVRSKLRFSLRAWLSLPSGGVRKGSGGAGVGAQGLQRHPPPPRAGGEHSAHYRVFLQGSPRATPVAQYLPCLPACIETKAQGGTERA